MKYRHHIVFCTDITGDKVMHESFDSDDVMPQQSEVMSCMYEFMKKHNPDVMKVSGSYKAGVRNISTVLNGKVDKDLNYVTAEDLVITNNGLRGACVQQGMISLNSKMSNLCTDAQCGFCNVVRKVKAGR